MFYRKSAEMRNPSIQDIYKKMPKGAREERKKSKNVIAMGASQAAAQEKKVVKKKCKRSPKLLSESSKNLPFLSDHRHHMMQSETIFQTMALQERPPDHQQCKRLTTS
jgi:hypothetical protein